MTRSTIAVHWDEEGNLHFAGTINAEDMVDDTDARGRPRLSKKATEVLDALDRIVGPG